MVQRILDNVLWPCPATVHWVACQQSLCQTWEWTFSAPWDKMVMKCPPQNHAQVYEQKGALLTEDWHLPSTSTKIKSWPLQLLTFNAPERSSGWKSGMGTLCSGKNWQNRPSDSWIFSGEDFMSSNSCIFSYLRKHWPHYWWHLLWLLRKILQLKSQNRVAMVQTSWEITRWHYDVISD